MGTGILVTESYFLIYLTLGLQDSQFRSMEVKHVIMNIYNIY